MSLLIELGTSCANQSFKSVSLFLAVEGKKNACYQSAQTFPNVGTRELAADILDDELVLTNVPAEVDRKKNSLWHYAFLLNIYKGLQLSSEHCEGCILNARLNRIANVQKSGCLWLWHTKVIVGEIILINPQFLCIQDVGLQYQRDISLRWKERYSRRRLIEREG